MKVVEQNDGALHVEFSLDEAFMLNNALNEICNGVHIDDWEFATRLGWDRSELRSLLAQFNAAISLV